MASLRDKFVEELQYLRRLGGIFARSNPGLERFLGDSAVDPGVERLREGFAFLTAKLRLKIEDDFPELTQPLLQALDPSCLRPTPGMTIMRFAPMEGSLSAPQHLPQGTVVQSRPVHGVRCQFRTCTDVTLLPLTIESISDSHSQQESLIHLNLAAASGTSLHELDCDSLEFHLSCDEHTALTLYCWLGRYLQQARLHHGERVRDLPRPCIQFSGFSPGDALLPQPAEKLDGYRILQEYFVYPARFHFFRVTGLRQAWPPAPCQRARLTLRFRHPMPPGTSIQTGDLSLFCTPAVNLLPDTAGPISLDNETASVALAPASHARGEPRDIFSVDAVSCSRRTVSREGIQPVQAFRPYSAAAGRGGALANEAGVGFYVHHLENQWVPEGVAHRLAFLHGDGTPYVAADEVAQVRLTCTQGALPLALRPGDICHPTGTTTRAAEFTNLTMPSPTYPPVLDGGVHWQWISNLSPNPLILDSTAALASFLRAYDIPGLHNLPLARATQRKLDAMRSITTVPVDRMFRDMPVRGSKSHLVLDPDGFGSEGEMYLFLNVLSHVMALFPSTQSFHILSVSTGPNQEPEEWPIRFGAQPVM
ncbi:type VI secretion system baseplate subunit TssF [Burkholderia sp. IMCC1007]|uniref:type VI secretion system baseplate subunit TssF n=1 Tax=Burkholderia sp. IMCC1007 TaxID=3004104 RepID=UPI0022B3D388|nr:type VI secretion system baseplate subunit TssF [Burkholderia sp. IMCC1007]